MAEREESATKPDGTPQGQAQPSPGSPEVHPDPRNRSVIAFADKFPEDPQLRELLEAFERGQYNLVRERAAKLAQTTDDPQVAKAAQELRRRLDPDPLAVKMLLGAVALLVVLSVWAYLSGR
jgi:hypothetical protein